MEVPIHQLMDPPAIPSTWAPPSGGPSAFASQVEPRGSEGSARHGEAPQTFGHRSQRRGKATSRPGAGGGKFFAVKMLVGSL